MMINFLNPKKQKQNKVNKLDSRPSLTDLVYTFSRRLVSAPHRVFNSGAILRKAFATFVLFLMAFVFVPTTTSASLEDDLNDVNNKINEANKQLSGIKNEKKTLQGQVAEFDSQIYNIEQQISLTNQKISLLNEKIKLTQKQTKEAKLKLEEAQDKLSEVIRVMYEEGQSSAIEVIAKSNSFNEFINRSEYLEQVQFGVKEAADEVVALKDKLEIQQKELEEDRKEAEEIKKQQSSQKQGLAQQKSIKDSLLAITKGNEAKYQALLKNLQYEQQRIQNEIWRNSNNWISLGEVKQGDVIGYQGNSGWSTGTHLHFEVRTPSKTYVNPMSYIGNGYFSHPLPGSRITCVYGNSCYYGHTGTDFSRYYGAPIYASADGEIVYIRTGMGNTYPSSVNYGNYVIIRHTNGWYTWYAHLQ